MPPPVIWAIAEIWIFDARILRIGLTYIFVGFKSRFPKVLLLNIFLDKDIFFSNITFLIKEKPFACIPLLGNPINKSPALVFPFGKSFLFSTIPTQKPAKSKLLG